MTSNPKRPLARGPALRGALIDTALEMIRVEGVASVSLREVARRAGVTPATPYYHVPSRAALLASVAELGFAELGARIAAALAARADAEPFERLVTMCEAYVACAIEHPAHYRVMFLPELVRDDELPGLRAAAEAALDRLTQVVHALRPAASPAHARVAAITAWSTTHGFVTLWNDGLLHEAPGLSEGAMSVATLGRMAAAAGRAALELSADPG
jgi:AcrR family transcriptional regulator